MGTEVISEMFSILLNVIVELNRKYIMSPPKQTKLF